jgi:uncharacterized protein (UPF0276 family)
VHGVALSLGSAEGVDEEHLERLAELAEEIDACLISEHLAWSRFGGIYLNDLLPLPLTEETLDIVSANVARTQDRLGRAICVENPSGYLGLDESTIGEAEFLARLTSRTGCSLLLDLNNLFVSAVNIGTDIAGWLTTIPREAVAEIHLAGHEPSKTAESPMLIDSHGAAVARSVWALYARALAILGPRPTLIEWDSNIPPLETLLGEAAKAHRIMAEMCAA